MSKTEIKLDHAGFTAVLNSSEASAMVRTVADQIAGSVRASLPDGTDVVVDTYTTDRAAASVTIRDINGRLWQARDGVLTRAASANGAEVTGRG